MIIAEETRNVAIANAAKPVGYGVKLGTKFYEIMEGGIYKDKIGAIIRELSANAIDSHIMAGKADVPFDVHLPNSFDPHFSIRDYGVGLTPDEVSGPKGVYTTYFESTKTKSNEQIGAWGLGSKTPFSYVDSFVVTSWKNGLKSVYDMFKDADGERRVVPMVQEVKSDEPTGLLVQFPVKLNDFHMFYDRAVQIMSWFKVLPKLTGHHVDFKAPKYFIKTEKYGVLENRASEESNYVLVENMVYKLAYDYNTRGIVYFAKIGDVEVTTSREELNTSAKTNKFIEQAKNHFNSDIRTQVQSEINKCQLKGLARKQWLYKLKHSSADSWLYKSAMESTDIKGDNDQEIYQYSTYRHRSFKQTYTSIIPHEQLRIVVNDTNEINWAKITKKIKLMGSSGFIYYLHRYTPKWLTDNDLDGVTVKLSSIVAPKTTRTSQKGIPKNTYVYTLCNGKLVKQKLDPKAPLPVYKSMLVMKGLSKVEWLGKEEPLDNIVDLIKEIEKTGLYDKATDLILCHERTAKYFAALPKYYDYIKSLVGKLQPVVDKYEQYKNAVGIVEEVYKTSLDTIGGLVKPKSEFKNLCSKAIMPIDLPKVELFNRLNLIFGLKKEVKIDHSSLIDTIKIKYPLFRVTSVSNWSYFAKDFAQYVNLVDGV